MNTLASWAEHLARAVLRDPLPRRWAHVQGVAARARSLAPVLGADADLLEAAAWPHDIGYAPGASSSKMSTVWVARICGISCNRDQVEDGWPDYDR